MFNYLRSTSGVISAFVNGRPLTVPFDHPFYQEILVAIQNKDANEFVRLADLKVGITEKFNEVVPNGEQLVTIQNDQVYYKGVELHNVVTERILNFIRDSLPVEGLVRFLENLMQNPSYNSVKQLFSFLDHHFLPITEDGCFLAYKKVRADWLDYYSGTIDNSVGSRPSVERNTVDDDPDVECSNGLHVGCIEYVRNFNSHLPGHYIVVKVNPKHAVSVPCHDATKMRVCEYYVQEEMSPDALVGLAGHLYKATDNNPVSQVYGTSGYGTSSSSSSSFDDEDEDEFEEDEEFVDDEDEDEDDEFGEGLDQVQFDSIKDWCARTGFDHAFFNDAKVKAAIDSKNSTNAIQFLYAMSAVNGDLNSQQVLESDTNKQSLIDIIGA